MYRRRIFDPEATMSNKEITFFEEDPYVKRRGGTFDSRIMENAVKMTEIKETSL